MSKQTGKTGLAAEHPVFNLCYGHGRQRRVQTGVRLGIYRHIMYRLIYVSTASDALAADDIENIIATAQRNNAARDITGILLFNGLNFLQVLEGPRKEIEQLFMHINMDQRHVSVVTVLQEEMKERIFRTWAMAHRVSPQSNAPGRTTAEDMSDILEGKLPEHVQRVLNNFDQLKGI